MKTSTIFIICLGLLILVAFLSYHQGRKSGIASVQLGELVRKEHKFILDLNAARQDKANALQLAAMWEEKSRKLQDENRNLTAAQIYQKRRYELQTNSPVRHYSIKQIDSVLSAIRHHKDFSKQD